MVNATVPSLRCSPMLSLAGMLMCIYEIAHHCAAQPCHTNDPPYGMGDQWFEVCVYLCVPYHPNYHVSKYCGVTDAGSNLTVVVTARNTMMGTAAVSKVVEADVVHYHRKH